MKKERLSKLQKWIITECYKVTVLQTRDNLRQIKTDGYGSHINLNTDFFKEDILLSYFNLQTSNKYCGDYVAHFKITPDYNKAHVTTTRTLKNLTDKGLIYTYKPLEAYSLHICLTVNGEEKAKELLETSKC